MKQQEMVYREIACRYINGGKRFTQLELSRALGLSLSTVNGAVSNLEEINAVRIGQRSFEVISLERLLLYWATMRRIEKDIAYSTRVDEPVKDIEGSMPPEIAFTSYTAYKLLFKDVPADYSEVYVYAAEKGISEIKRRFSHRAGPPNLFVLEADKGLGAEIKGGLLKHSSVCPAQVFVDLWNLKAWYAKDFIDALEKRLGI